MSDGPDAEPHPGELWAADLYAQLISYEGVRPHRVAVIGQGNDDQAYVAAGPDVFATVQQALEKEGYDPRATDDQDFTLRIVPPGDT